VFCAQLAQVNKLKEPIQTSFEKANVEGMWRGKSIEENTVKSQLPSLNK